MDKNVSKVKDKIIASSIESLREEGLKFSIDTLADKLKISKKTVYKYFSSKEALAIALYDKYYSSAFKKARELSCDKKGGSIALLNLYYDL